MKRCLPGFFVSIIPPADCHIYGVSRETNTMKGVLPLLKGTMWRYNRPEPNRSEFRCVGNPVRIWSGPATVVGTKPHYVTVDETGRRGSRMTESQETGRNGFSSRAGAMDSVGWSVPILGEARIWASPFSISMGHGGISCRIRTDAG